jgi:hypothetical protein
MQNVIIFFMLFTLSSSCTHAQPLELNDTISDMLLLINQGKVKKLFARHTNLFELKNIEINISKVQDVFTRYPDFFEKKVVNKKFMEVNLQKIQTYLHVAKHSVPKFSKNNTSAVYRGSEISPTLKFTMIGSRWLLNIDDRLILQATILIGRDLLLDMEKARSEH